MRVKWRNQKIIYSWYRLILQYRRRKNGWQKWTTSLDEFYLQRYHTTKNAEIGHCYLPTILVNMANPIELAQICHQIRSRSKIMHLSLHSISLFFFFSPSSFFVLFSLFLKSVPFSPTFAKPFLLSLAITLATWILRPCRPITVGMLSACHVGAITTHLDSSAFLFGFLQFFGQFLTSQTNSTSIHTQKHDGEGRFKDCGLGRLLAFVAMCNRGLGFWMKHSICNYNCKWEGVP